MTHCLQLNLQLHTIGLVRTCRISSFCTVAWQLARFQLTRRIARSLGDSWASCVSSLCHCLIFALLRYSRVYSKNSHLRFIKLFRGLVLHVRRWKFMFQWTFNVILKVCWNSQCWTVGISFCRKTAWQEWDGLLMAGMNYRFTTPDLLFVLYAFVWKINLSY